METSTNEPKSTEELLAMWEALRTGKLPPRPGDFVKSKMLGRVCGFIVDGEPKSYFKKPVQFQGYEIRMASGKIEVIPVAELEWVAPVEWDEL